MPGCPSDHASLAAAKAVVHLALLLLSKAEQLRLLVPEQALSSCACQATVPLIAAERSHKVMSHMHTVTVLSRAVKQRGYAPVAVRNGSAAAAGETAMHTDSAAAAMPPASRLRQQCCASRAGHCSVCELPLDARTVVLCALWLLRASESGRCACRSKGGCLSGSADMLHLPLQRWERTSAGLLLPWRQAGADLRCLALL